MPIHAPGKEIVGARRVLGWARGIGRVLPSAAPHGSAVRRGVVASLPMTSMIDVLVVLTVFLLLTFSASDECGCRRDLSRLPDAQNVRELVDAPVVEVSGGVMRLDGIEVASREDLSALATRARRIDGLSNALRTRRALARAVAPDGAPLRTNIVLAIDGDVPAGVVKSVALTAAGSGYAALDFMVQAR